MEPFVIVKDIESKVNEIAGLPDKPLRWDGKYSNRWGRNSRDKKNNKWGFSGDPDGNWGILKDYTTNRQYKFRVQNLKIQPKKPIKKPTTKSALSEYSKLKPADKNHPYLKNKGIDLPDGVKKDGQNLIVPVYSQDNEIVSWQAIDPDGEKKFKYGHILPPSIFFSVGALKDKVFVCEGFATACSIHKITGHFTTCSFTKGNLDNVVKDCFKRFSDKKIVLCLDNDGVKTHKTTTKGQDFQKLTILCPDQAGDFNDFQEDQDEINKLKNLYPFVSGPEPDYYPSINLKDIKIKPPVSFYENILLDNDFNFLYGDPKIGKTRGIVWLIVQALKDNEKAGFLSSENDPDKMFKPLLKVLKADNKIEILNTDNQKLFPKTDQTAYQKIQTFLKRLEKFLIKKNIKCLLIDPLPRGFIDWNKEDLSIIATDGLREVARKTKCCIIGVRNEGKNKALKAEALYKGSSGLGDNSRQVIRALKCHPKSHYGKWLKKGIRSFIIYTELSSFFSDACFHFKIEDQTIDGVKTGVPDFIGKIEKPAEILRYLCSPESGKSLSSKIFKYLSKQPGKGATMDDLYDEFGDFFTKDNIRKTSYRHFDTVQKHSLVFVFLKKPAEN